jgi:hypothetical protein
VIAVGSAGQLEGLAAGTNGYVLTSNGPSAMPSYQTPVPVFPTKTANTVLAGPTSGSAAVPTFRALVAADLPIATTGALGAVKPDGATITISGGGVISAVGGGSALTQIAKTVLGSPAASITFSTIPGTYTNLLLVVNGSSSNSSQDDVRAQFNGDTGSNYDYAGSYGGNSSGNLIGNGAAFVLLGSFNPSSVTNHSSSLSCTIPSYSGTSYFKNTTGTAFVYLASSSQEGWQVSGGWRNTGAITSIKLFLASGNNFTIGTTAALYGIS